MHRPSPWIHDSSYNMVLLENRFLKNEYYLLDYCMSYSVVLHLLEEEDNSILVGTSSVSTVIFVFFGRFA